MIDDLDRLELGLVGVAGKIILLQVDTKSLLLCDSLVRKCHSPNIGMAPARRTYSYMRHQMNYAFFLFGFQPWSEVRFRNKYFEVHSSRFSMYYTA